MADTATEPTADSIMAMAAAFDRGEDIETPAAPKAEPAADPAAKPDAKAKDATPATEPAKQPDSKDSKAVVQESKAKPDEAEKPKSKWAQNEERKNKTWQEINAEKDAVKAEKEALAREKAALEQSKKAPADAAYRDENGHTAADYKKVAIDLRAKGDVKTADAAEQVARQYEQKEAQQRQAQVNEQLTTSWKQNYEKACERIPALKDISSPEHKEVVAILNGYPLLTQSADGLNYAIKAMELSKAAREADTTKTELNKLKEEHAKLQKKLSIGGGSPTGAPAEDKSFKDMTDTEQRKFLEQKVAQYDRAAGFD